MAKPFDRRSFLARSAATAAGVVAAGSAGELLLSGTAGAVTNGKGRNGISTAKPVKGGTLVFGVDAEEQGFNPSTSKFDEVGVMYARTVFDPLTIITPNGGWAPYLAQSVTSNAEYTSWTITLRPNVVFHDGTPCDGAAMLLNFEAQAKAFITGLAWGPVLDNFQQTGPLSVVVNLKTPWVPFPYWLAGGIGGQVAYMMAPAMINSANGGTDNPIGTGPFKFVEWIPNDHFTANAFPGYWRSGYPYLNTITYKPIVDPNARSEALQSGSIDMMVTDTPQVIVLYRGQKKWSYIDDSGPVIGQPDMNCVMLNMAAAPFNNPDVRLAMAKSLSAEQYSRIIDLSIDAPSTGLFVPGTPYYSSSGFPTQDVSGAKSLVKKVQSQTGKPVSFTLTSTNGPEAIRAAQYMQQLFQNVGMKVTTAVVEQNDLINLALAGTYQALEWRQFGAVNPDLNYVFWSPTQVNTTGISINMARNTDPKVEAQLQIGRTSTDQSARIAAYQQVNELLAKDLPYIWNDRAVWAVISSPQTQNWNNPTTPTGAPAAGMIGGSIWPTQIWKS